MAVSNRRPQPEDAERNEDARARRVGAFELIQKLGDTATATNDDESHLGKEAYPSNFTKGLPHDEYGQIEQRKHSGKDAYEKFIKAINQKKATDFNEVPRGLGQDGRTPRTERANGGDIEWRGWESPRTGHYFDSLGADADRVGMPPAPQLGSEELSAEIAEVYALALLRDVPFSCISESTGKDSKTRITSKAVLDALAGLSWFSEQSGEDGSSASRTAGCGQDSVSLQERRRRAARRIEHGDDFDIDNPPLPAFDARRAFRGSAPGAQAGPYVSQFMLLGNSLDVKGERQAISLKQFIADNGPGTTAGRKIKDASIGYGAQQISQKIVGFEPGEDYLLHWNAYLDVQNGADFGSDNQPTAKARFITTPRNLATYVRYDALYQAYLNACLFMLGELGTPDTESEKASSGATANTRFFFQQPVSRSGKPNGPGFPDRSPQEPRQGFATFGGPHVLTMVTEVATRCLKAVRRQKFNYHRRARPERLGALLTLQAGLDDKSFTEAVGPRSLGDLKKMSRQLSSMLALVDKHNQSRRSADTGADKHLDRECLDDPSWLEPGANYLLPMAFAEGSPMHPSYGAGHATVAGGCVTMLKAFFHTVDVDDHGKPSAAPWPALPVVQPNQKGEYLEGCGGGEVMTVAGELNKLAANISIGRDMAGVHFYTDYYESLRMGERVATSMLIEQLKHYNEPVELNFLSFDGDHVHLLKDDHGAKDPKVVITDSQGRTVTRKAWWIRHAGATEVMPREPVKPQIA